MSTSDLPCENHKRDAAVGVCGLCGTPVCHDCAKTLTDPLFQTFNPGGWTKLVGGVGLLVGVPAVLWFVYPDLVLDVSNLIFGGTVFLKTGVLHSAIIIGAALLLSVWITTGDGFGFIKGYTHERILCEDCYHERKHVKFIRILVIGIAGLVALYGLYTVATDGSKNPNLPFFFREIRIVAVGVAVYILRDEITILIDQLRG